MEEDVVASSKEMSILTFAWRGYERTTTKNFNQNSRSQVEILTRDSSNKQEY